jgi:hypothetical protein
VDLLHEGKLEEGSIEEGESAIVRVQKFIDSWSTCDMSMQISRDLSCTAMDQKPTKKTSSQGFPSSFWDQYFGTFVLNFSN